MDAADGFLLAAEGLRLRNIGNQPINLTVEPGERIGILGERGSGRGRLLRTLARLEVSAAGRIWWNGVNVTRRPRWLMSRALRESVILIWENPYVLFEQNLMVRQLVESEVHLVEAGLTPAALDLKVSALSGLARVRLALAYAAQRRPKVILLDDVFHHLAPTVWQEVTGVLASKVSGETAVVVASRYSSALQAMERVLVVSNGDIIDCGASGEVFPRIEPAHTAE